MLHESNTFLSVISNVADGTQPSNTMGTQITPGNNTYPAYTEILGDTSEETYFIWVMLFANNASAAARDTIVTLGFDFSGGTTYTDMEIAHLVASSAATFGHIYEFPVRVPAGTSVAAKASVNNATVGTVQVWIKLYGSPTHPELIRYGSFVRTFGADTANSCGTAITPGGASEGAYSASLGTTAEDLWAWEFGRAINDATMNNNIGCVDIAVSDDAGTTKRIIIDNAIVSHTGTEQMTKPASLKYHEVKAGAEIYGRQQGAPDGSMSLIVYGVGG